MDAFSPKGNSPARLNTGSHPDLIAIIEKDGQQLVSGRELHGFLEVKSRFADWIKNRIRRYGFTPGFDYTSVSKILENGGRELDYALSLDMGKELAMVEGNAKGKQARLYFIQCEKKLQLAAGQAAELMRVVTRQQEQLRQIAERTAQLEARLRVGSSDYYTIMGYSNLIRKAISFSEAQTLGKRAKTICQQQGYNIPKVRDTRFGLVNSYPLKVLQQVVGE